MISIEVANSQLHFTKAVFIWTGHTNTGWPTSFDKIVYNDELNGFLTYGHGDEEIHEFTWFIPSGSVVLGHETVSSAQHALELFKLMYGDRLIIWMNPKEDCGILRWFMKSDFVVKPTDLGFEPFDGSTRNEFQEWAQQYFQVIESMTDSLALQSRV